MAADLIGVRTTPLVIGGAITALTTVIPLIPGVQDPTISAGDPTSTARRIVPGS